MDTSSKGSILVVDDSPVNGKLLSDALRRAGFIVLLAEDGTEAIQTLQDIRPDLILMDVMMPKMDGFKTCRQLKLIESTQDIPVIFMTSLSEPQERVKGLTIGVVDYITKPFQAAELLARVNIHLQVRNLNKNLEQQVEERTAKLTQALNELKAFQLQLVQREKMSALGQLVSGIGHEINNPLNFVAGNLNYVAGHVEDLVKIIRLYQHKFPKPGAAIKAELEKLDLEDVSQTLFSIFGSMQEGTRQVKEISNSLKVFARSDNLKKFEINLDESINSTLLILGHRLKPIATRSAIEVMKNYGDIPLVPCFPGLINQVFMNLLTHAIDSIDEASEELSRQPQIYPYHIRIDTELDDRPEQVKIRIRSNGKGIPVELSQKIFEPIFTLKSPGKGAGLGLSISHQIIVEKYNGDLICNFIPGQDTEFSVTLPVA